METSTGGVTVSTTAADVIPFRVAVIVVVPMAIPVAIPEVLTVATDVFSETQVTLEVRFCVV